MGDRTVVVKAPPTAPAQNPLSPRTAWLSVGTAFDDEPWAAESVSEELLLLLAPPVLASDVFHALIYFASPGALEQSRKGSCPFHCVLGSRQYCYGLGKDWYPNVICILLPVYSAGAGRCIWHGIALVLR